MSEPKFTTVIPGTGPAGNTFIIVGTARSLMRQLGVPRDEIEAMTERVTKSRSYAEALAVVREWFPVDTGDDQC